MIKFILMEESIINFATQFNFDPEIKNKDNLKEAGGFVVSGMGGSNLATDILKNIASELEIVTHRNYGLPVLASLPQKSEKGSRELLFIASSFSGNTEETLDFAQEAYNKKLNLAVITKGGRLLEFAEKEKVPFIKIPETNIQPRMALGFSILALVKFIKPEIIHDLQRLSSTLNPIRFEDEGEELVEFSKNKIPLIYSSERNQVVARIWKIKLNETGKIPAFFNVFPELNHNEMTGFDYNNNNFKLSEQFCFIFIKDEEDHKRISKRMEITAKIFAEKNLKVKIINPQGKNRLEKIFNTLLLADWMSLFVAENYESDPEKVPMVEKLKELIK